MTKNVHPHLTDQGSEGGAADRVRFDFSIPRESYLNSNMLCATQH